jgi:hypothetical protein
MKDFSNPLGRTARMMEVSSGPHGDMEYKPTMKSIEDSKEVERLQKLNFTEIGLRDTKQNYHNWQHYKTYYNAFDDLFEELEKQGEDPYVVVSY